MPKHENSPTDNPHDLPVGSSVPYDSLNSPGAYVDNAGRLLRVPQDAIAPGRSPKMSITSRQPLMVTKISSDPFVLISKAATICADNDLAQTFI